MPYLPTAATTHTEHAEQRLAAAYAEVVADPTVSPLAEAAAALDPLEVWEVSFLLVKVAERAGWTPPGQNPSPTP